ncbi:response regulator transcription factor [Luedemannella flava]|uniref:Response regulator transcription factor n=1 Tax=Luedemannella flava TaxID=349316 RepID=A0ABP4Y6V2_9ACTN
MIRVVLVEPQGLLRGALHTMLASVREFRVVPLATIGDAARHRPDVLVIDIDGPDGPDLVAVVGAAPARCGVLVLTGRATPVVVRQALDLRVRGVVDIDSSAAVLVDAVRKVARGEWAVDPATVLAALRTAENPLTDREREVLRIAGEGVPVRDIASRLFLAEGTVRNHLSAAMRKIGAPNRIAAARAASDAGWL